MRMNAQTARIEAGSVLLPRQAGWLGDLRAEILPFPAGRYSDQVDTFSQALHRAFNARRTQATREIHRNLLALSLAISIQQKTALSKGETHPAAASQQHRGSRKRRPPGSAAQLMFGLSKRMRPAGSKLTASLTPHLAKRGVKEYRLTELAGKSVSHPTIHRYPQRIIIGAITGR
jgi:hypothetical protein